MTIKQLANTFLLAWQLMGNMRIILLIGYQLRPLIEHGAIGNHISYRLIVLQTKNTVATTDG